MSRWAPVLFNRRAFTSKYRGGGLQRAGLANCSVIHPLRQRGELSGVKGSPGRWGHTLSLLRLGRVPLNVEIQIWAATTFILNRVGECNRFQDWWGTKVKHVEPRFTCTCLTCSYKMVYNYVHLSWWWNDSKGIALILAVLTLCRVYMWSNVIWLAIDVHQWTWYNIQLIHWDNCNWVSCTAFSVPVIVDSIQ
jgi:hypothetical protein